MTTRANLWKQELNIRTAEFVEFAPGACLGVSLSGKAGVASCRPRTVCLQSSPLFVKNCRLRIHGHGDRVLPVAPTECHSRASASRLVVGAFGLTHLRALAFALITTYPSHSITFQGYQDNRAAYM